MSNKTKRTHSIQVRLSDEENDDKINELLKLARSISNNFNQVAVRANSGGKVYPEDISALREGVEKLWQPLRFFQSQLMSLHH